MKIKLSILSGIIALSSLSVYASSGNTNANVCHNSKKEGYYCHSVNNTNTVQVSQEKNVEQANLLLTNNLTNQDKLINTLGINFEENFLESNYEKKGNFYYYKPKKIFHSFENYYFEVNSNKISKIFADQPVSEKQCKLLSNYLEKEILDIYGKTNRIRKSKDSTFIRYDNLDFVIMCNKGKLFYIVVNK